METPYQAKFSKLYKLEVEFLPELGMAKWWRLTTSLAQRAIDDICVDNCHIDQLKEQGLVVQLTPNPQLQRVSLKAMLVVDVHTAHQLLVIFYKLRVWHLNLFVSELK